MSDTPLCTCLSFSRDPFCIYHGHVDKATETGFRTHCEHCGQVVREMTDEQYTQHWDGKCPKKSDR